MLIIRKEQMEVFEKAAAPHFEIRLAQYLAETFPQHCASLGEDRVREAVRIGISRAAERGLASQDGARLYTDLMFRLGWNFDGDPQLPWAGRTLSDPGLAEEEDKLRQLGEEADAYLEQVLGPGSACLREAGKRMAEEPVEGFPEGGWFEPAVADRLRKIWPQKSEALGDDGVRDLMRRGAATAGQYGITVAPGLFLCIGLMYILGSGFDRDPLVAWVARTLSDKDVKDQVSRVRKLHAEAVNYLKQMPEMGAPS